MGVGVIRVEVELFLECDVNDYEAGSYVDDIERMFPDAYGVNIAEVKVKDNTVYDNDDN
jgi:hypothetical protein